MIRDKALPERRHGRSRRRGSLIIEAVIAVALLATAGLALTRLASSAALLSRHSSQTLAATLTAENTIERFRGLAADQVLQRAADIGTDLANQSGCQVQVETDEFLTSEQKGIHIQVTVTIEDSIRVVAHDWRLSGQGEVANRDDDQPSEDEDD